MIKETHLLIIWSEALDKSELIIDNLKESFEIKRIFQAKWQDDNALENLIPFYAHSQKEKSYSEYIKILQNKIKHCGKDSFLIVIFEDTNPLYQDRKTSTGVRSVNVNVFDRKKLYRDWTGGGHKIHATDNQFEVNKDLTVLFGKNLTDFYQFYDGNSDSIQQIIIKCFGVGGFKKIHDLFYLLNNTIEYCVLRNFECLPDKYTLEGHGDIDLLVENLNYIVYLTGAKSLNPEINFRVQYEILINNQKIPFDFRYCGDKYLDINWEYNILKSRVIFNDLVHIPNEENHFWTLFYHAIVQKPLIKEDYSIKLNKIAESFNLKLDLSDLNKSSDLLKQYIDKNEYFFETPIDKTVYFNQKLFFNANSFEERFGKLISDHQFRMDNEVYRTFVYVNNNIITKVGAKELIENEIEFINELKAYDYFPKYISDGKISDKFYFIQIGCIDNNCSLKSIDMFSKNFTFQNVKFLILDLISITKILAKHGILHRDIRPSNILIKYDKGRFHPYLIDFGCSANFISGKTRITPYRLGSAFKYDEGQFSDFYSMGKTIKNHFGYFDFPQIAIKALMKIKPEDYSNINNLKSFSKELDSIKMKLTIKDKIKLVLKRNPKLTKITKSVK